MLITFLYRLSFGDGCGAGFIAESEWDSRPEENARLATLHGCEPAVQAEKGTEFRMQFRMRSLLLIIGYRLSAIVYNYRLSVKKRISYR